jgi:hypothetical protein
MFFIRNCPKCNKEINYKYKKDRNSAEKNNKLCQNCCRKDKHILKKDNNLVAYCSKCNKEHYFKTERWYNNFLNKACLCKDCLYKEKYIGKFIRNCPECKKEITYKDLKNVEYCNKHNILCSSCTKKKIMQSKEVKEKISNASKGQNNPMANRSFYEVWLQKYGEEVANEKLKKFKENCSQRYKGENNPMYGKPSPKRSGNGYSGYYKEHYFRSILELSYLKYLLDSNIRFESCENKKYRIEYQLDNKQQTYFPDFCLLDTEEIIEIKPKNLLNNKINKVKFEAAQNKYGNRFKVLTENDFNKLEVQETYELYINKEIIFDKNYEQKFLEYYQKESKR